MGMSKAFRLVGCAKPLALTISEPEDGATVNRSEVWVYGKVSDRKATVMVNDVKARVFRRGKGDMVQILCSAKVTLTQGENIIKVIATQGKEAVTKTVTVTYSP